MLSNEAFTGSVPPNGGHATTKKEIVMEILGFDRVELVVQGDQIENAAYGPRSALDPASI